MPFSSEGPTNTNSHSPPSISQDAARQVIELPELRILILEELDRGSLFNVLTLSKTVYPSVIETLYREISFEVANSLAEDDPQYELHRQSVRTIRSEPAGSSSGVIIFSESSFTAFQQKFPRLNTLISTHGVYNTTTTLTLSQTGELSMIFARRLHFSANGIGPSLDRLWVPTPWSGLQMDTSFELHIITHDYVRADGEPTDKVQRYIDDLKAGELHRGVWSVEFDGFPCHLGDLADMCLARKEHEKKLQVIRVTGLHDFDLESFERIVRFAGPWLRVLELSWDLGNKGTRSRASLMDLPSFIDLVIDNCPILESLSITLSILHPSSECQAVRENHFRPASKCHPRPLKRVALEIDGPAGMVPALSVASHLARLGNKETKYAVTARNDSNDLFKSGVQSDTDLHPCGPVLDFLTYLFSQPPTRFNRLQTVYFNELDVHTVEQAIALRFDGNDIPLPRPLDHIRPQWSEIPNLGTIIRDSMEAVLHTFPDLADQSGKVQPTYIPRPNAEEETALLSSLRAALGSCETTSVAMHRLAAELEAFHQLHQALKGTLSELELCIILREEAVREEAEGRRKNTITPMAESEA